MTASLAVLVFGIPAWAAPQPATPASPLPGLSQVAQDAGVSQSVLSRFVAGDRDIHLATADKLAEVLGLNLVNGS